MRVDCIVIAMDIKKIFGQNLKKYRKSRGYTQIQFAEALDVDQKHISFIESGYSFPSAGLMTKMAEILKIPPKNLFDFENPPSVESMKENIIQAINIATDKEIEKIHNYVGFVCVNNFR